MLNGEESPGANGRETGTGYKGAQSELVDGFGVGESEANNALSEAMGNLGKEVIVAAHGGEKLTVRAKGPDSFMVETEQL